jgi:tetratricopeptide (TPR) repeat protein
VRGTQSDEALDLRTGCLNGRLDDVRALTDLLRHADAQLVDNAYGAVLRLRPLAACADVRALRAAYEPVAGEKAEAVEAVRRDVAGVVARWNSGRCEEATPITATLADRARALGYAPVEAEVLFWRGRVEQSCGSPKAANEALMRAAMDAQESHQDELFARILVQLAHLEGAELAHYDEALDVARLAEATIRRLGAPEALLADLARSRGWVEYTRGDLSAALPLRREALDRHVRAVGGDDPDALQMRAEIADLEYEAGHLREALEAERDVLHRSIDLLGPRHMRTGRYTLDIAETLIQQGKYDEAQPWIDRARPLVPSNVVEHLRFVEAIQRIGSGDVDAGVAALDQCARDSAARYGAIDPYPLSVRADVGKWLAIHRRQGAATDVARAVLEQIEAGKEPDNPWYPNAYATQALLLARAGRADDALRYADRAIAVCERGAAAQLPFALLARGEALLARHDATGATAALERAQQLVDTRGGIDPLENGDIRAALSRATAGLDEARSRRLADEARAAYAASRDTSGAAQAVAALAAARP